MRLLCEVSPTSTLKVLAIRGLVLAGYIARYEEINAEYRATLAAMDALSAIRLETWERSPLNVTTEASRAHFRELIAINAKLIARFRRAA
jgi:hypothetical protein